MKKILSTIIFIFLIFVSSLGCIGALFKIMHWPYANELLIIGLGAPAIAYFFFTFIILIKMLKTDFDNKYLWLIGLIACPFIVGILFLVFQNKILNSTIEN